MIKQFPIQKDLQKSTDYTFSKDIRDFFSERRAGHLSKWLYSTPRFKGDPISGAEGWQHVIQEAKNGSSYYIFQDEKEIITTALPKIKKLFLPESRLIDLGPGSQDAVRDKILPIIKLVRPLLREHMCIDVSEASLTVSLSEIKKSFPALKAKSILQDFFQDSFIYVLPCRQEIALMFGLTIYNMPIDPRIAETPLHLLISLMKRLCTHFTASKSQLIITQDTNQDFEKLKKAYLELEFCFRRILYKISEDLNVSSGFDPNGFQMEVDYFKETQACATCFVTNKNMKFSIDGEFFNLFKGQRLYFNNSYKFDIQTFLYAINKAGFRLLFTEKIKGNPCVLHALERC
jgi:uncharacterized SAM-dependent methyltransferase